MKPEYVDAFLIGGVTLIIAFGVYVLAFVRIPQDNLAILASILSGLTGTVIGGWAGYRWGASMTDKHAPRAGTASVSIQATTETPKEAE